MTKGKYPSLFHRDYTDLIIELIRKRNMSSTVISTNKKLHNWPPLIQKHFFYYSLAYSIVFESKIVLCDRHPSVIEFPKHWWEFMKKTFCFLFLYLFYSDDQCGTFWCTTSSFISMNCHKMNVEDANITAFNFIFVLSIVYVKIMFQ